MTPNRSLLAALTLSAVPALAGGFTSGPKLTGKNSVGSAQVGFSVALSADGNTAVAGGPSDDSSTGAVWIYTRTAGVWSQQGAKLIGTGGSGPPSRGAGVALSADGNTLLVGGPFDASGVGAAWVFTRSNGVWTQQGAKLVGAGGSGVGANQGYCVALSADGNTAAIGGHTDGSSAGATWIFTRSSGVWSPQGGKLVGSGASGASHQGFAIALSSDGNTLLVGGNQDAANVGASWVFTRSAGVWTQQGAKLVGTGATGPARQGFNVALSADGNTALVGGATDNSQFGAAWVFTRSGGVWTQQGAKLVGGDAIGAASQGSGVALSADGNTAAVGGFTDDTDAGAAWVFTRSAGVWTQQGNKIVATGESSGAFAGADVALSADAKTLLVGGYIDNNSTGAAWVFTRTCLGGDINGDGALTVNDVFYLINFLFAGGVAPTCY